MSEAALWATLKRNLGPRGELERVENAASDGGTPDVCYCLGGRQGWLELKHVTAWPKRQATPVRVPSLTIKQVLFAERWDRAGGVVWCLLQVERDYLLLPPTALRDLWDLQFTYESLPGFATMRASGQLPTEELYQWLRRRHDAPT